MTKTRPKRALRRGLLLTKRSEGFVARDLDRDIASRRKIEEVARRRWLVKEAVEPPLRCNGRVSCGKEVRHMREHGPKVALSSGRAGSAVL